MIYVFSVQWKPWPRKVVTAIDWAQMQRLRLLLLALFAYRTWDDGGPECNPGVETSDFLAPKNIGKKAHICQCVYLFGVTTGINWFIFSSITQHYIAVHYHSIAVLLPYITMHCHTEHIRHHTLQYIPVRFHTCMNAWYIYIYTHIYIYIWVSLSNWGFSQHKCGDKTQPSCWLMKK